MKLNEVILAEAFAVKLANGEWVTTERPSYGPLITKGRYQNPDKLIRTFKTQKAADEWLILACNQKNGHKVYADAEIKRAPSNLSVKS
jgi:hypothetical protein